MERSALCGRDDQQGTVAGDYIAKNFKGKNIAIINDKTTYGKGLADETKKALNEAGVNEKMYESYNKGDKDFNALVSKLKLNNIDLVYVGGYHQEAGLILRQMRDQGLKTILMAGDALADKEFASITGAAGEGTLFTFGPDPRNKPTAAASRSSRPRHRSGRLHALHLRRVAGLGAAPPKGRHHRSEEGVAAIKATPGTRCSARSRSTPRATSSSSTTSSTNGTPRAATPRSTRRGLRLTKISEGSEVFSDIKRSGLPGHFFCVGIDHAMEARSLSPLGERWG